MLFFTKKQRVLIIVAGIVASNCFAQQQAKQVNGQKPKSMMSQILLGQIKQHVPNFNTLPVQKKPTEIQTHSTAPAHKIENNSSTLKYALYLEPEEFSSLVEYTAKQIAAERERAAQVTSPTRSTTSSVGSVSNRSSQ